MSDYSTSQLIHIYRPAIDLSKGVVLKVGTNVVSDRNPFTMREDNIEDIVNQGVALVKAGKELDIVTSAAIRMGAIKLGLEDYDLKDTPLMQSLSSAGNHKLFGIYDSYLSKYGYYAGGGLFTYPDLATSEPRKHFANARKRFPELRMVGLYNENDLTSIRELIPQSGNKGNNGSTSFGDNDMLAAMIAEAVGVDLLVIYTSTYGLLASEENVPENTIPFVAYGENFNNYLTDTVSTGGSGGGKQKAVATRIATGNGSTVIWVNGRDEKNSLNRLRDGERLGTVFEAQKL